MVFTGCLISGLLGHALSHLGSPLENTTFISKPSIASLTTFWYLYTLASLPLVMLPHNNHTGHSHG